MTDQHLSPLEKLGRQINAEVEKIKKFMEKFLLLKILAKEELILLLRFMLF
jgi:hypothetical protein